MYASDNDEYTECVCAECGKHIHGEIQTTEPAEMICSRCARAADAYDRDRDDKLDGLGRGDW